MKSPSLAVFLFLAAPAFADAPIAVTPAMARAA